MPTISYYLCSTDDSGYHLSFWEQTFHGFACSKTEKSKFRSRWSVNRKCSIVYEAYYRVTCRAYPVSSCLYACLNVCQVLKVDHNNLVEVPSLLGRLERLTSFNCASQRPRVRLLPGSITRLHQLQVLCLFCKSVNK